jgi:16S rRNA (adenine1518-N6/adenine1519-N6)-dimethyltransferase
VSRQKLGQHFLVRGAVLERIARAACGEDAPLVVEIGPGRGALTDKLLGRAGRVVAVEVDPYLAGKLREKYAGHPRLEIVHADVLRTDLGQWGPAVVAGNLPYYITSPILEQVLGLGGRLRRAVLLIQKEVAARLVAAPGDRDYGYLTVRTALAAEARWLFDVKPAAFHPPPKVDSSVVRLDPCDRMGAWGITSREAFLAFVGACFRQKRKTLRNNLAPVYGREVVDIWPEAGLRAEQIAPAGFADIFSRLRL